MDEICDACSVAKARTTWVKGELMLVLCGHHTDAQARTLEAQGFVLALDERELVTA